MTSTRSCNRAPSGDFGRIGVRLQIVGESLCEAVDLRSCDIVLDVAAGNGNASLAAPGRFADMTSTDYVPELLDQGLRRDGLIQVLLGAVGRLPTPECEAFIAYLGGAINRVPANATAHPHRDVIFVMNVHTRWRDLARDQDHIARTRHSSTPRPSTPPAART